MKSETNNTWVCHGRDHLRVRYFINVYNIYIYLKIFAFTELHILITKWWRMSWRRNATPAVSYELIWVYVVLQDPPRLPFSVRISEGVGRAGRDQTQSWQAAEGDQLATEHRRQDTGAQHEGMLILFVYNFIISSSCPLLDLTNLLVGLITTDHVTLYHIIVLI